VPSYLLPTETQADYDLELHLDHINSPFCYECGIWVDKLEDDRWACNTHFQRQLKLEFMYDYEWKRRVYRQQMEALEAEQGYEAVSLERRGYFYGR